MNSKNPTNRRILKSPIGYLVIVSGLIVSALSIDYQSSITAFIGVSLVFWGALLLYIRPAKYVSSSILNALTGEQMLKNHLMYDKEGYNSKPIYQAKTSLEEMSEIYVSLSKNASTKEADKTIEIMPIGLGLHNLAEKEMKVNFNSVNLKDVKNSLEKYFVESLEVADSITITDKEEAVDVEITGNVFQESLEKSYTHEVNRSIGDPLTSAIACILTRVKNSQVIIDKIDLQKKRNKISVHYKILKNNDGE